MAGAHPSPIDRLLAEIEAEATPLLRQFQRPPIDPRVIEAIRRVPRERFVDAEYQADAYDNRPLPIGHGQTVSQPLMVAVMTELLDLKSSDRVLDVGTGSGYQAAVLAELAAEVYCLELEPELLAAARRRLTALHHDSLSFRAGNGWLGWPEAAPFDAILVAAAARDLPPRLLSQLAKGGRMVVPVDGGGGDLFGRPVQTLVRIHRDADGQLHRQDLFGCAFVPFRDRPTG